MGGKIPKTALVRRNWGSLGKPKNFNSDGKVKVEGNLLELDRRKAVNRDRKVIDTMIRGKMIGKDKGGK